jgi:hypothetical protein
VARGAYFKARTRTWLKARGYQVADLEKVAFLGPRRVPVKVDQFGADLLAMNARGVVFVQVKGGKQCLGRGTFPAARRTFAAVTWGPATARVIVAWPPRSRVPRVLKVSRSGEVTWESE